MLKLLVFLINMGQKYLDTPELESEKMQNELETSFIFQ